MILGPLFSAHRLRLDLGGTVVRCTLPPYTTKGLRPMLARAVDGKGAHKACQSKTILVRGSRYTTIIEAGPETNEETVIVSIIQA